jgi:transcriptional regulator
VLIIALIDLATMGQERRIRVLKRCGHSQQAIADRLGITRYRVRLALAS